MPSDADETLFDHSERQFVSTNQEHDAYILTQRYVEAVPHYRLDTLTNEKVTTVRSL
jgi:hypothetical protein